MAGIGFEGRRWFVVMAHPGRPKRAEIELQRQGYAAWVPVCRVQRRRPSALSRAQRAAGAVALETVVRPLFENYLFVGVADGQPFRPIRSTIAVAGVLTDGAGAPIEVPVSVLAGIRERAGEDGIVCLLPKAQGQGWVVGKTLLRLLDGPFKDFVGLLDGVAKDNATLLLDLFGRQTVVSAPIGAVAAEAGPHDPAVACLAGRGATGAEAA